ncbi:Hpt domain-containing protein [Paenirhodobacter enshiensis]|uniref:Hpt domain-containing protein n=1 Tax=Paenirhodobacter enshiensis TaxID=1105367 RepID=UPI003FA1BC0C
MLIVETEAKMINWDRIEDLRTDIGEEEMAEVIDLFLDEVEQALSQIGTAPDREAAAHFLKGAALNLGFSRFAAECLVAEQTCHAHPPARVEIAPLRHGYGVSRQGRLPGPAGRAPPPAQIRNSARISSSVMSR